MCRNVYIFAEFKINGNFFIIHESGIWHNVRSRIRHTELVNSISTDVVSVKTFNALERISNILKLWWQNIWFDGIAAIRCIVGFMPAVCVLHTQIHSKLRILIIIIIRVRGELVWAIYTINEPHTQSYRNSNWMLHRKCMILYFFPFLFKPSKFSLRIESDRRNLIREQEN